MRDGELYDWIEANEPDLHARLCAAPPPIDNALRILGEACGFEIDPWERIEDTTPRAIAALKAKRAAGEVQP